MEARDWLEETGRIEHDHIRECEEVLHDIDA